MPKRLEVSLRPELFDAEGATLRRKANDYFGFEVTSVRTIHILTLDLDLAEGQFEAIRKEAVAPMVEDDVEYG